MNSNYFVQSEDGVCYSKRARSTFTAEEVTKICARSNNDPASDIDSVPGGLSSEEEFQLDHELEDTNDSELEMR